MYRGVPPPGVPLGPPLEFHQQLMMVIVSDVRIHGGWAAKIARGRPTLQVTVILRIFHIGVLCIPFVEVPMPMVKN